MIEIGLALCGLGILAVVAIAIFYKAPSCTDGIKNQDETGIDCGGSSCTYLCSVDQIAPKIAFARAVSPQPGRTDVIAYIDNANTSASVQGAVYKIQIYGVNQKVLSTKTGTINMPPSSTVPLYVPNAYDGPAKVETAFVSFDPRTVLWVRNSQRPILPIPSNINIQNTVTPRITATLTNPSASTLYNVTIVATVYDISNPVIAASQTVVPVLSAQNSSDVVFTWNQAFSSKPVRVEILPTF
jgi:hypothetical protein